jgi:molybdopterin converting factor small subunit
MRVEFYGIPRERAGFSEVEITAATLGELLMDLLSRFPKLADIIDGNRLRPSFVANLNGDQFVVDPRTKLATTDCLLILSADAGG